MKNINLLARQPVTQKYATRLISLSLVISLGTISSMVAYGQQLRNDVDVHQNNLERLDLRIKALMEEKKPDPRTLRYNSLLQEITALKAARADWTPFFRKVLESIPVSSRLNRILVNSSKTTAEQVAFHLSVDLRDWMVLKEYVAALKANPLIASVQLQNITNEKMVDPMIAEEKKNAQKLLIPETPQTITPPIENKSGDPFLQSLNNYLIPGSGASNYSAQNGLSANNSENTDSTDFGDTSTGAFTSEDFKNAEQILQQSNPVQSTPVFNAPDPAQTASDEADATASFLRCELELLVKLREG